MIKETFNRTGLKTILIQHSGHIPITEVNATFEEQENLFIILISLLEMGLQNQQ